jgi:mannosyltransferase OCH1-like enzyme
VYCIVRMADQVTAKEIPKIIHQIWLGPHDPPTIWMDTWKENFCPKYAWEYRLWRDADVLEFGLVNKKEFDGGYTFQEKADIARYEILYRHGGIYLDCDMIWLGDDISTFVDLSASSFIGVQEYPSKWLINIGHPFLSNGMFMVSKNNKILQNCIDKIPANESKEPKDPMYLRTGPGLLNSCISQQISIIPYTYVFPVDFHKPSGITDPVKEFKGKAFIFTYNGSEYPHIKKKV